MLTDLVGPWGQLLSVLVNISWGWLEDWRLEYCKGCLLSGVWAGNIQTAGAGNLRLLRHLSLPGIVCPAWLRAPKVHIPRKRERDKGKSHFLLWPSLGGHKMSLLSHCICWKGSTFEEKVTRLYFLMKGGLRNLLPCFKPLQLDNWAGMGWDGVWVLGSYDGGLAGRSVFPWWPPCHIFTFWFVGIPTIRHSQTIKITGHRPFLNLRMELGMPYLSGSLEWKGYASKICSSLRNNNYSCSGCLNWNLIHEVLTRFILITIWLGRHYHYAHFSDEETEAQEA